MEGVIVKSASWVTIVEVIILEIACIIGGIIASVFYQKLYRPTFAKND
jgi:formate hydrogenlyase subunit 3/multisubunit Na+/H+ antiporter MnhD subunit